VDQMQNLNLIIISLEHKILDIFHIEIQNSLIFLKIV